MHLILNENRKNRYSKKVSDKNYCAMIMQSWLDEIEIVFFETCGVLVETSTMPSCKEITYTDRKKQCKIKHKPYLSVGFEPYVKHLLHGKQRITMQCIGICSRTGQPCGHFLKSTFLLSFITLVLVPNSWIPGSWSYPKPLDQSKIYPGSGHEHTYQARKRPQEGRKRRP